MPAALTTSLSRYSPTGRSSPTESIRLTCWHMTLHPLHLQPEPSTRVAMLMTAERRLIISSYPQGLGQVDSRQTDGHAKELTPMGWMLCQRGLMLLLKLTRASLLNKLTAGVLLLNAKTNRCRTVPPACRTTKSAQGPKGVEESSTRHT